jgi:hypothetical protein
MILDCKKKNKRKSKKETTPYLEHRTWTQSSANDIRYSPSCRNVTQLSLATSLTLRLLICSINPMTSMVRYTYVPKYQTHKGTSRIRYQSTLLAVTIRDLKKIRILFGSHLLLGNRIK